jgi:hypothetical protein
VQVYRNREASAARGANFKRRGVNVIEVGTTQANDAVV